MAGPRPMVSDSGVAPIAPAQGIADFRKAEQADTSPVTKTILPGSAEWEEKRTAAGQAARAKAIAEGKSVAVADAVALDAYTNYGKSAVSASDLARAAQKKIAPAQGIADFRKTEQAGIDTGKEISPTTASAPASVATSAKAIAGAAPAKLPEVLDKLKEEEAKGGPDFWDVIEAASAGWGGRVPLYVQKELQKKEAETQLEQAETIAQKQAEIAKAERQEEQKFQREMTGQELANRLAIAGIKAPGASLGLNPIEFAGIK